MQAAMDARGLHAMQIQIAIFSQTQIGEAVLPWRKLAQASDKQTSRHTDTDIHDEPNGWQIRQDNFSICGDAKRRPPPKAVGAPWASGPWGS